MSQNKSQNRILWMDSLRGGACLIVFFAHIIARYPATVNYSYGVGKIGVWFFMLSSGYLLLNSSSKNDNVYSSETSFFSRIKWIPVYYLKKAIRLYPCFVIGVLLTWRAGLIYDQSSVIRNLCLLEGTAHLWFVPVIVKFYLVAPLFIIMDENIKSITIKIMLLLLVIVGFSVVWPFTKYPENSVNLFWYMPVFLLGIVVYYLSDYIKNTMIKNRWIGDLLVLISFVIMIILTPYVRCKVLEMDDVHFLYNKYLLMGMLWSIILLGLLIGKIGKKCLEKLVPFQMLSRVSYPVYIFHYPIIFLIIGWFAPTIELLAVETLGVTIVLSVIYYYIEKKAVQRITLFMKSKK